MARTTISSLNIKITGDARDLRRVVAASRGIVKGFGGQISVSNNKLKEQQSLFTQNARAIVRYVQRLATIWVAIRSIQAVKGFLSDAVTLAADAERQQILYTNALRDSGKAAQLLQGIVEFGEATPFRVDELREAGLRLLQVGESANSIIPTLRTLGDVSAGSTGSLSEVARIYVQSLAEGKVLTRDIRQFATLGLPIYESLARVLGGTGDALSIVGEKAEDGEINVGHLQRALVDMTEGTGRLKGATDALAGSFQGTYSNFQDELDGLKRDIGEGILPNLQAMTEETRLFVELLRDAQFEGDSLTVTIRDTGRELRKWTIGIKQGLLGMELMGHMVRRMQLQIAALAPAMSKLSAKEIEMELMRTQEAMDAIAQKSIDLHGVMLDIDSDRPMRRQSEDAQTLADFLKQAQQNAQALKNEFNDVAGATFGSDKERSLVQQRRLSAGLRGVPQAVAGGDQKELKDKMTAVEWAVKKQERIQQRKLKELEKINNNLRLNRIDVREVTV